MGDSLAICLITADKELSLIDNDQGDYVTVMTETENVFIQWLSEETNTTSESAKITPQEELDTFSEAFVQQPWRLDSVELFLDGAKNLITLVDICCLERELRI